MAKRAKQNKATDNSVVAPTTTVADEQVDLLVNDTPPGADQAAQVSEKPKLTDEEKKAKRSARRKERRLAKLAAEGKVPRSEAPRTANGALVPREGGARAFCYKIQVAHGFPDPKQLAELMRNEAKGTPFEGKPNRWFARRAWRNARLYKGETVQA